MGVISKSDLRKNPDHPNLGRANPMIRMSKWTVRLLAMIALASPAFACAESARSWTQDQQSVIDLLKDGPMGIETDFEAWESEFHNDWTVWFAGKPEAKSKVPHMAGVRDYIGRGAKVVSYTAEFADVVIHGDTALARFNAIESLINPDGTPRVVHYASTDLLVRAGKSWKILATTVAFLPDASR
jgi:hypothetical protein